MKQEVTTYRVTRCKCNQCRPLDTINVNFVQTASLWIELHSATNTDHLTWLMSNLSRLCHYGSSYTTQPTQIIWHCWYQICPDCVTMDQVIWRYQHRSPDTGKFTTSPANLTEHYDIKHHTLIRTWNNLFMWDKYHFSSSKLASVID